MDELRNCFAESRFLDTEVPMRSLFGLVVALLVAACMPSMRHRVWEIRITGTADSVRGSYITGDIQGAESHAFVGSLPATIQVSAGALSVGAMNGRSEGDTLRIEIWEGGKLRRQVSSHRPGELVGVVASP